MRKKPSDWPVEPGTVAYVPAQAFGGWHVLKYVARVRKAGLYWVFEHRSFDHWKSHGGFFETEAAAEQALRGAVNVGFYTGEYPPPAYCNTWKIPTLASLVLPALENL
jgi:hypothetical protein